MAIKLVREFKQNQQLSITPQLKKSIDLLQLSRLEIINKINHEIEDNPFLKRDFDNELASDFNDMDLLDLKNVLALEDEILHRWYFDKVENKKIPRNKITKLLKNFKL